MLEALVSAVSFPKSLPIKVIDIGCGTGTISNMVLKNFPNAQVTCLDIAQNMVEKAKIKLSVYSNVRYITEDITYFNFDDNYDVAISSQHCIIFAKLVNQLTWLSEIGFVDVDVIWKYYNLSAYSSVKL